MSNLTKLKDLGVKTMQVKDHFARAVNPYEKWKNQEETDKSYQVDMLPPLPTHNIPDGTVSIEQVEEKWKVVKGKFCLALVKKQVKEEEPKGCKHPLSYLHSNDVRHYCPDCGRFLLDSEIPVKVEAQEQKVEDRLRASVRYIIATSNGYSEATDRIISLFNSIHQKERKGDNE